MKAQIISKRVYVHFPYTLGIISCFGEFSRQSVRVIPGNIVFIAHTAMVGLLHSGMQSGPGGDAAGAGAVSTVKRYAFGGQSIQIRGLYVWMTGIPQTISSKLVCHN